MTRLTRKTLFICFYFPPFNRVGGRRWAKHLKYLSRLGSDFWVLAGNYNTTSNWDDDLKEYEEKITRIPVKIKYPYFKQKLPYNLFEKIFWQLSRYYWNLRSKLYRGNYWDDSVGYEKKFYQAACKLIDSNHIEQIVITLGPFNMGKILVKLKKNYPHIKIIVDYRDRLEDSFFLLSEKSKRAESEKQKEALDVTDAIYSPNEFMFNYYKLMSGKPSFILPHSYDEEDFLKLLFKDKKDNQEKLEFIYGGALYSDLDNNFNMFFDFLRKLEDSGYEIEVSVYTHQTGYKSQFDNSGLNIKLYSSLPQKEYFEKVLNSDMAIVFRPDWSDDSFSSKYFELVRLKVPLLYIGKYNNVAAHIKNNQLGFLLEEINDVTQFKKTVRDLKDKIISNEHYDTSKHSFKTTTEKFVKTVNSLL